MAAQSPLPCLLTRPEAASQRFAALLATRFDNGLTIAISPVIEPEFLNPEVPDAPFDAMILTSETAVAASLRFDPSRLPRRAICVGDRTAVAAREAGFTALSAKGDAGALTRMIAAGSHGRRFLHLAGTNRRGQIADRLAAHGIEVHTLEVYSQIERPLSAEATLMLAEDGPLILPLFSPRSAGIVSRQVQALSRNARLLIPALSDAVAAAVGPRLEARIFIATRPDAAAMSDAVAKALAAGTGP